MLQYKKGKGMNMDRNEQFIELYNRLDNLLREYYHLSERSFSVIKRYEDELKKSSLWKNRERGMALESIRTVRNTLVHEPKIKNQDIFMIEESVLDFLKKEIDLLIHPWTVYEKRKPLESVVYCHLESKVKDITNLMQKKHISHVPVLNCHKKVIGVFSESTIYTSLLFHSKVSINDETTIQNFIPFIELDHHSSERFAFLEKNARMSDIYELFDKRKPHDKRLVMIFITENGSIHEPLLGILTLPDLIQSIE